MPLSNPFRRTADRPSLRERAAELRASLTRPQQPVPTAPEPEAEATVDWYSPPPGFMASPAIEPESFTRIPDGIAIELQRLHGIAQAEFERRTDGMVKGPESDAIRRELRLDVLSMATRRLGQHPTAGGIAHGDGTVSFTDASGVVLREPMARWVGFVAMQMHGLIQGEISRQRIGANALDPEAYQAWEEGVRRALRSDAVHALAFRHLRAFEAAQALRNGTEPATRDMRGPDDAKLVALAAAWEAAVDLLQQREAEEEAAVAAAPDEGWPVRAPKGTGPEWDEYLQQKEAWRERHGIIAAENASSDAATALHEIELRIAGLSAASLAGLKLKARVGQRHDDIGLDWPDNLGAGLARDILAFVETALVGRPDLTKPDTLAAAILDGWKAWGTTPCESEEAWNRASEQRDRLLYAAMALPATPESIPAKALACAWMEWVNAEHPGQPRDAYGPADQLVYDLHTAMMGRATSPTSQTAPSYSYLVDQIDFASATMSELLSLRDIANCIGDVTYAHAWGARCHKGANASGATDHNQVGKLVNSLGDALTAVESAAEQEARQREPGEEAERSTRLYMLAPATIDNGDPDEIEAFARELLAHAEAERTRG